MLIGLNSINDVEDFILGMNSQFCNYKECFDKRSQFLISGLSKNSYTMSSGCLFVSRPDSGR